MKLSRKLFFGICLLSFSLCFATFAVAEAEISDEHITLAVEGQIVMDPGTDLNNLDITTALGVVTLSGTVEDLLKKERAVSVAQTVKGVRSVIDKITVAPPKRPDGDIQRDIVRALAIDPVTESWEIGVDVNNGSATLTGAVESFAEKSIAGNIAKGIKGITALNNDIGITFLGTRPDDEIREEVVRKLRWNSLVDAVLLEVEVNNGEVVLSGVVGSAAERARALSESWVAGVKDVDTSALEVNWWAKDTQQRTHEVPLLSDDEIEKAVEDSLLFDPRVKLFNVAVSVENGIVTLSGVVDNLMAKRAAANDARNTLGVWSVKNHLKVRPAATPDDKTLAKTIDNVLAMDPVIERYRIDVTVNNGMVYLNGTVDSYFEKAQADHIVSSVMGVREVYNRLKIIDNSLLSNSPYVDPWYTYDYPWYLNPNNATFRSDLEIQQGIRDELFWSPFIDSNRISVDVENGHATLTGKVDSWFEYRIAKENAFEGGAVSVNSELRVVQ